jgi:hypothetical protein
MPETQPGSARPPGGSPPPAPPGTADPSNAPEPAPPQPIRLDERLLGDVGHPLVDTLVLSAILSRQGPVGRWLNERGVNLFDLHEAFPTRPRPTSADPLE